MNIQQPNDGHEITRMRRLLAQGIHASVYEAGIDEVPTSLDRATLPGRLIQAGGVPGLLAIKIVQDDVANMPPHNVVKEVKLLKRIAHRNIVTLLQHEHSFDRNQYRIYLPRYAITLTRLLDNPYFSPILPQIPTPSSSATPLAIPLFDPLEYPSFTAELSRPMAFCLLANQIASQLLKALRYLHNLDPPIAHRDIKPSNIMIDWDGNIRVIDFGIAAEGLTANGGEVGGMRCQTLQVGAGAYRAPELLFGAKSYSPLAIDVWAAGVTIASMFTPLQYGPTSSSNVVDVDLLEDDPSGQNVLPAHTTILDSGESSEDNSDDETGSIGIVTPGGRNSALAKRSKMDWRRQCLFESGMGDLGLVWSILRIKGTPTDETWPSFASLPDSSKLSFNPTRGVALSRLLPILREVYPEVAEIGVSVIETIEGMLDYDADSRWSAERCLLKSWLEASEEETSAAQVVRKKLIEGFLP